MTFDDEVQASLAADRERKRKKDEEIQAFCMWWDDQVTTYSSEFAISATKYSPPEVPRKKSLLARIFSDAKPESPRWHLGVVAESELSGDGSYAIQPIGIFADGRWRFEYDRRATRSQAHDWAPRESRDMHNFSHPAPIDDRPFQQYASREQLKKLMRESFFRALKRLAEESTS